MPNPTQYSEWGEYKMLVMDKLESIEQKLDKFIDNTDKDIEGLKLNQNTMQVKMGVFSGFFALLGVVLSALIGWMKGD